MALPYGSYNIDYANVVAVPGQSLVSSGVGSDRDWETATTLA